MTESTTVENLQQRIISALEDLQLKLEAIPHEELPVKTQFRKALIQTTREFLVKQYTDLRDDSIDLQRATNKFEQTTKLFTQIWNNELTMYTANFEERVDAIVEQQKTVFSELENTLDADTVSSLNADTVSSLDEAPSNRSELHIECGHIAKRLVSRSIESIIEKCQDILEESERTKSIFTLDTGTTVKANIPPIAKLQVSPSALTFSQGAAQADSQNSYRQLKRTLVQELIDTCEAMHSTINDATITENTYNQFLNKLDEFEQRNFQINDQFNSVKPRSGPFVELISSAKQEAFKHVATMEREIEIALFYNGPGQR